MLKKSRREVDMRKELCSLGAEQPSRVSRLRVYQAAASTGGELTITPPPPSLQRYVKSELPGESTRTLNRTDDRQAASAPAGAHRRRTTQERCLVRQGRSDCFSCVAVIMKEPTYHISSSRGSHLLLRPRCPVSRGGGRVPMPRGWRGRRRCLVMADGSAAGDFPLPPPPASGRSRTSTEGSAKEIGVCICRGKCARAGPV